MHSLNAPTQAVILAAGMGSRLKPHTDTRPKPLVEVHGVAILHNALHHLAALGVKQATLVVGYRKDAIEYACGPCFAGIDIDYIESSVFRSTGSAYSLWLARDALLTGDCFLLEGDVFFERAALERLIASPAGNAAAIAPFDTRMEGSAAILDGEGAIAEIRVKQTPADLHGPDRLYKTMNLIRFAGPDLRRIIVPALDRLIEEGELNVYTEQLLARLIREHGLELAGIRCDELKWWEIDSAEDLAIAQNLFANTRLPGTRHDRAAAVMAAE